MLRERDLEVQRMAEKTLVVGQGGNMMWHSWLAQRQWSIVMA